MRKAVEELIKLGRMPDESIDDDESVDEMISAYESLMDKVEQPITKEEAEVLIELFPDSAFYDMQWDLLRIVESMIIETDTSSYREIINQCPSDEWRHALNVRFDNWIKETKINDDDD